MRKPKESQLDLIMRRFILVAVLLLTCPLVLAEQAKGQRKQHVKTINAKPVAKILIPALQKIKQAANTPILLPSRLPRSVKVNDIRVVDGEVRPDGYAITLFFKER